MSRHVSFVWFHVTCVKCDMCHLCHVMWHLKCVCVTCDIFVMTCGMWHVSCVVSGDGCGLVPVSNRLEWPHHRPETRTRWCEDKRTCWALRSNKWSSSVYSGHRPNTAATLTRIPEWLKHCVRNNKAWVLRREMHAGGVAESSGPWNDDKDPFEVWRQYWTNPFPLLFTVNVRKRSKSGYFLW